MGSITDEQYNEWWERWCMVHRPVPMFVELVYSMADPIRDFEYYLGNSAASGPIYGGFAVYMNGLYVSWLGESDE